MRERLRIPVYYDFASTICYVAHRVLGRMDERIAELGIELEWRPVDLSRIVRRPRGVALPDAARENAERVARELAVPVRTPPRWLDSRPAAAAALAIDDPARRATWRERVFTAAFEEGLDIGADGAVSRWLEALGFALPTAAIERGLAELEAETERAREAQVSGVPTLMLGEWPIGGIQDERTTLHLLSRYARKRTAADGVRRAEGTENTMNPNQALWEKGDFTRIAQSMRESGEALARSLGITQGLRVLDLGCGDGTTALPEARLGADVLGVDIARNLVEAGNRRAREAGLARCRFQEGDASDLRGLADDSFDLVVSIFGAMFAPKPFDVAREMVRVTKPGGRIVMGNWIPNDPTLVAQILKISSAYSPPPPEGFVSPMTWGVESHVLERFGAAGVPAERVSFARDTWTFAQPGRPEDLVDTFRQYYGPTMNAFEAAGKNGRSAELLAELEALFRAQNRSASPDATSIPATFLRVTAVV